MAAQIKILFSEKAHIGLLREVCWQCNLPVIYILTPEIIHSSSPCLNKSYTGARSNIFVYILTLSSAN